MKVICNWDVNHFSLDFMDLTHLSSVENIEVWKGFNQRTWIVNMKTTSVDNNKLRQARTDHRKWSLKWSQVFLVSEKDRVFNRASIQAVQLYLKKSKWPTGRVKIIYHPKMDGLGSSKWPHQLWEWFDPNPDHLRLRTIANIPREIQRQDTKPDRSVRDSDLDGIETKETVFFHENTRFFWSAAEYHPCSQY